MTRLGRLRKALPYLLAAAVVVAGVAEVVAFEHFKDGRMRYDRLALGDSRQEVMYHLGSPAAVQGNGAVLSTTSTDATDRIPVGKTADDFPTWWYNVGSKGSELEVTFDRSGQLVEIYCTAADKDLFACGPMQGIWVPDSETRVKDHLGKPSSEKFDLLGNKVLCYADLGICIVLAQDKALALDLKRPQGDGPILIWRFLRAQLRP